MVSSMSGRPRMNPSRARREGHVAAGLVDRRAGGLDPGQRRVEIVERRRRLLRRVLDRQAGHSGGDAACDVFGNGVGVVGKAVLEIGVERKVGCRRKLAIVHEHIVHRLPAIRITLRMGMTGAGGRQRLEAEALEIARAADIPRIGNDEAAGLVQRAEGLALVGGGRAGRRHGKLPAMEKTKPATASRAATAHFDDTEHEAA